jgi:hypothetical protein
MRRIYGDAGHLQRLYLAVRTAAEYQSDNLQALCEYYLRKYRHLTTQGSRKKGLLRSEWRSAEPHFSLAKELDLLEWKERERWRITFGAGRAFLSLWNEGSPPQYLLLHQLLSYDRTFTIPFIIRLVEANYDFASAKFVGLENHVREVWREIWNEHRAELEELEPPLPGPEEVRSRTLLHHASARIRLLNKIEGLSLNIEKLDRLALNFQDLEYSENMPNDSFFRIGDAIGRKRPRALEGPELTIKISQALASLQRAGYASGHAIYLFVNEKSLPSEAVDWNTFVDHVRKVPPFATRASFRSDDLLVTVDSPAKWARIQS